MHGLTFFTDNKVTSSIGWQFIYFCLWWFNFSGLPCTACIPLAITFGELSTASVCGDLTFSGLPCTSCVFLAMLAITFGKYQVYVSDSLAFSDLPRISVSDCYAGGGGNSHLVSIGSMHPIHLDFIDSDYSENIHMLITTLRLRLRIYFCLDCLLRYISKCARELGDCEGIHYAS